MILYQTEDGTAQIGWRAMNGTVWLTQVKMGALGATVNMVSGGLLRTTDANVATPDAVSDIVAPQTPLGHVTTPKKMADAVLFFGSLWVRAMTGQDLFVDAEFVFG